MFTPRSFRIGDHVKINAALSDKEGTFAAGHEFTIIDIHFRGDDVLYDLRDRDVRLLGDVPHAYLERMLDDD